VQPSVGTHFDSMAEAFEFYSLYSWELGFGIRFDRSRRNMERSKTIQDIVCTCSVSAATYEMFGTMLPSVLLCTRRCSIYVLH